MKTSNTCLITVPICYNIAQDNWSDITETHSLSTKFVHIENILINMSIFLHMRITLSYYQNERILISSNRLKSKKRCKTSKKTEQCYYHLHLFLVEVLRYILPTREGRNDNHGKFINFLPIYKFLIHLWWVETISIDRRVCCWKNTHLQ